jgi:hypothetical protein
LKGKSKKIEIISFFFSSYTSWLLVSYEFEDEKEAKIGEICATSQ